ncbi:carbohydrate ABC transporter permease [Actinacidiphila epipremni]|uniref:Carbohydrate ABC transporter permease n=1 Tax=Actinacidiphila epipremni TaxID=2053013 RepID=A0ABX0ZPN0_9ACTN|nr:carbohydrate ABC transporter permease [Actinacidiphila epipremni]NJP44752.1 carbohydrate ABC transporter permease [Actinacidiphila epipremni]
MSTTDTLTRERRPHRTAAARSPRRARARRTGRPYRRADWAGGAAAAVWLVIVAVPLYYVVASSLRDRSDYLDAGPLSLPHHLVFSNYRTVLDSGFPTYLWNSIVVSAATVALVLLLALPAAYAVVRSRSRFVSAGFSVMLMGLAIPAQATIVPVYLIITRLHVYDTLLAVILPTAAFSLPMAILVLTSTMRDIPGELYEAMTMDGAAALQTLRSLVLPLSRPGLVTIGIYTALGAWNGFIFPLVLTQSDARRTVTLGLWNYQGQQGGVNVPATMAAVLLSLLPLLVAYLFGRRQLLSGLTAGFGK